MEHRLTSINFLTEYRTGSSDPITEFYAPCLQNSVRYKRSVGYFRSTIYLIVAQSTLEFAKNGGKIDLICSPDLSEVDIAAIDQGYKDKNKVISDKLISEFDSLIHDDKLYAPTRILATLISLDMINIKIALRRNGNGIYHEKIGLFIDGYGNKLSFIGSANETYNAWSHDGNFESIEVFCAWRSEHDSERCIRHEHNFDNLWSGENPEAETINFPEAARLHLCKQSSNTLEELQQEIDIAGSLGKRKPLPHQTEAIKGWIANGKRGVLEHATGSGKTFTAIEAAKIHLKSELPVLILVPSKLLLKQWEVEIKSELPGISVTLIGAGNNRWKEKGRLTRITSNIPVGPRVIIATMQTAATDYFLKEIFQGNHLMVIADEVHQIGSTHNSNCLSIESGPRLGLSATPKRYGDPEGTAIIFDYFGKIVMPKVTLLDALKSGRLVNYEYFPHPVYLTPEESDAWRLLTRKISFELSRNNKEDTIRNISQKAKMLILERSRIAKKADRKISLATKVIKENFINGQSWLVYCEDSSQLNLVKSDLFKVGINAIEYHTNMQGDQSSTLNWFKEFGGVLISIKCLDEGVDIPSISHAVILASSQNPRQFIQRRGRVLRKSPNKNLAVIHDAIVVPFDLDSEPEQASLLKAELQRAIEFSNSAINKSAGAKLRGIALDLGINLNEIIEDGLEEDIAED